MKRTLFNALFVALSLLACDGGFDFQDLAVGGFSGVAGRTNGGAGGAGVTIARGGAGGGGGGGGLLIDLNSFGGTAATLLACFDRCARSDLFCSWSDWPQLSCVECIDKTGCTRFGPTRPYCSVRNRCVECIENEDCPSGQICLDDTHSCITRCTNEGDSSCTAGPRPWCHVERGLCERCRYDDDCAGTPETPFCEYMGLGCVGCTNDRDCPTDTVCDPVLHKCVQCEDSDSCPLGQQCRPDTHQCEETHVE